MYLIKTRFQLSPIRGVYQINTELSQGIGQDAIKNKSWTSREWKPFKKDLSCELRRLTQGSNEAKKCENPGLNCSIL